MVDMVREGEYRVKFNNAQHMTMFTEFQGFANLFFGQDWLVYISGNEEKFVTSDNPVVVRVPERKKTGKRANEMTEQEWEIFYQDLSEQLRREFPGPTIECFLKSRFGLECLWPLLGVWLSGMSRDDRNAFW